MDDSKRNKIARAPQSFEILLLDQQQRAILTSNSEYVQRLARATTSPSDLAMTTTRRAFIVGTAATAIAPALPATRYPVAGYLAAGNVSADPVLLASFDGVTFQPFVLDLFRKLAEQISEPRDKA